MDKYIKLHTRNGVLTSHLPALWKLVQLSGGFQSLVTLIHLKYYFIGNVHGREGHYVKT